MESLKKHIRTVPDWPKKGIMFRDITPLLRDGEAYQKMIGHFIQRYKSKSDESKGKKIDAVAGVESRGFILGAVLAHELGVGFIPIRKKGKLPAKKISVEYMLEYGKGILEIHTDAVEPGNTILFADDLLATGGTALAACSLITRLGGLVHECCFVIDLPDLGGSMRLREAGYSVFNLMAFEGE